MRNNSTYTGYNTFFILVALLLFISLPVLSALPVTPADKLPGNVFPGTTAMLLTNFAALGFMFVTFRRMITTFQLQQENLLQQLAFHHASSTACEQAEKHFRDIKTEWDKLCYKRHAASRHAAHEAVADIYTGGDALEKYYEDIQEYGEDFYTQTVEAEYQLRYILLLIKSFVSDLQECQLPDKQKKQLFKSFFYFYSTKVEFHLENLHTETDGLAPFVQLHDETGEVQFLIEQMAAYHKIPSPND